MRLELWQNGKMLSSVILNYFRIGGTKKQGYSATVTSNNYLEKLIEIFILT